MRSYEEPNNRIMASDPNSSIVVGNSHAPHRQLRVQRLELKTWVSRILLKAAIGTACLALNVTRQSRKIATK
jgi:hypothetical protein